jgi:two-component system chemotaxis response regulator CheY
LPVDDAAIDCPYALDPAISVAQRGLRHYSTLPLPSALVDPAQNCGNAPRSAAATACRTCRLNRFGHHAARSRPTACGIDTRQICQCMHVDVADASIQGTSLVESNNGSTTRPERWTGKSCALFSVAESITRFSRGKRSVVHAFSENCVMGSHNEKLILIVEDDADTLEIATLLLTESGYAVVTASDAQGALEQIDHCPAIALVFTDLQMPGLLDGYGLISYLRADGNNLPAILTSGLGHSPKGLPSRTMFLSKPYNRRSLVQNIEAFVGH